jgi:hypothetical protein
MELPVIIDGLEETMDEVSKEIHRWSLDKPSERLAFGIFYGTLNKMLLDITERMGLNVEQQEDIQTICDTWLDFGILVGKSPQILIDVLKRAKPKVGSFTTPQWWHEKDRVIAEAERIIGDKSYGNGD